MPIPFASRLATEAQAAVVLARAGMIKPVRPDKLLGMGSALLQYGLTVAGAAVAAAARRPDAVGLVDDGGELTFRELVEESRAIARGMQEHGVRERSKVALLAPNSRTSVQTLIAAGLLGADTLLMNTGLSAGQVAQLCVREDVDLLVTDPAVEHLAAEASTDVVTDLSELAADGRRALPIALQHKGRIVIMTSGTTGTPKGAQRRDPTSLVPPAALLSRIPFREADTVVVAAPLFHTWGLAALSLSFALASTTVIRRRVDPAQILGDIAGHRAQALITVPIVLSRLLEVQDRPDVPTLRVVATSGSALPGPLAERFQDAFGNVLYNLYGSTEVSWATIATPEDLRHDSATAGKPPLGTTVLLLDEDGKPVPQGEIGKVFVANDLLFEGYTGDVAGPAVSAGMMTTGDLGRFDEGGRLTVLGRSDGMIVSGGENVFTNEVEDLLAGTEGVREASAVGVDDDQFGQRVAVVLVLEQGFSMTEDDVRDVVRKKLARFSVPRDVLFVDELPRNATGKIIPKEVKELLAAKGG